MSLITMAVLAFIAGAIDDDMNVKAKRVRELGSRR